MTHSILVVDTDDAFAAILKESLESTGEYQVSTAQSGEDVLESVVEEPFDMVIVDMGLSDVKPLTLVRAIREVKPSMRLMLIPLFGGQIPTEFQDVDIQGVLPKPFFVGDLPAIVGEALGIADVSVSPGPSDPEARVGVSPASGVASVGEEPPATRVVREPTPPEQSPQIEPPPPVAPRAEESGYSTHIRVMLGARQDEVMRLLKALNREVRAESIVLTLGAELVAFSGLLGRDQASELAELVAAITEASARLAAFLGEPDGRFEQGLHEGAEYCLYSLKVCEGLVLSLALSSDMPLGSLRYQTRQTAEELLALLT